MITTPNEESLSEFFQKIRSRIDRNRLLENTARLWKTELGQTFACYHASAKVAEGFLKEAGCDRVERIPFPADGKTVFQDKTMPLGWHASKGRLEVIKSAVRIPEPVVADFEKHPFHLIKGSVATPPGGIEARLISEEDLRAGADPRGAMVLLNPENRASYRPLRDTGILGIVSDNLVARYDTPTAIQWANACTESWSWHTRRNERPHIGFMVSPYVGDQLRVALRAGEVMVRVTSDGERREEIIEAVTGVIPGEDEREIWLLAHLYEPLANDNSSGVACAAEIVHALNSLRSEGIVPRPRFTLRLVFAMECYGFAAFAERMGGRLREKVLCALNLDALPILPSDRRVEIGLSQSGSPSCADYLLETAMRSGVATNLELASVQTEGVYADDRLYGDSTIGVPTLWVTRTSKSQEVNKPAASARNAYLWHNSTQEMSCIAPDAFHDVAALYGMLTASLLGMNGEAACSRVESATAIACQRLKDERDRVLAILGNGGFSGSAAEIAKWLDYRLEIETARLRDFGRFVGELPEIEIAVAELSRRHACLMAQVRPALSEPPEAKDPVRQLACSITLTRTSRGLPRDFAAVSPQYCNSPLEQPVVLALVHADGNRSVEELFSRAQWELRRTFSSREILGWIGSLQFLAKYGYVNLASPNTVTTGALVQALRDSGIGTGDLVLVHSALSRLGVVENGADTVIDALLEVIGETGTLLMPTFTRSFLCFEKGPIRRGNLVPFHPERGPVFTGLIPETFRRRPGVIRSGHPSHSIAGVGPLAKACLSAHGLLDAPTGPTSPWAKLHEFGGKIVFLGANLDSCTFLHYLENRAEADYLVSSICVVDDEEKGRRIVTVPHNVPGDRDFYRPEPEESKIFQRLLARGFEIRTQPIGLSKIKVMEAAPLYRLGMEELRKDPHILLRDTE